MNNYYEFSKLTKDGVSMDFFNFMSDEKLKTILDDYFNDIFSFNKFLAISIDVTFLPSSRPIFLPSLIPIS